MSTTKPSDAAVRAAEKILKDLESYTLESKDIASTIDAEFEAERKKLIEERDCWIFNAKGLQKQNNQWEKERAALIAVARAAKSLRNKIGLSEFQEPSHKGSCGPESCCDGICQDNAWAAERNDVINNFDKALSNLPKGLLE